MTLGSLTRGRVLAFGAGAVLLLVGVVLFLLQISEGSRVVGYLLALVGALVLLAVLLSLPPRHIWLGLPASRWILRGGLAGGFALIALIVEPGVLKVLLFAVAALQVLQALLYVLAWRRGLREEAGPAVWEAGDSEPLEPLAAQPAR